QSVLRQMLGSFSPYFYFDAWPSAWIGTLPLILAAIAGGKSLLERRTLVWALVALTSGVLATVSPLAFQSAPRWWAGGIARDCGFLATTALGLAMLAGRGLDVLVARMAQDRFRSALGWTLHAIAAM